jgi:hypothetical protein
MNSPDPKTFGVSPADVEWARLLDRKIPRYIFAVAAVSWAAYALHALIVQRAFHFESHDSLPDDVVALVPISLLYLFMGLVLVGITTMIVGVSCNALLPTFLPRYRRVHHYQKAVAAFRAWWIRTQKAFWLSLSGKQFEQELANLYRRAGLRAELTSMSGDHGVDIWLYTKRGKEIVQCKAHGQPVGPAVIRELYGTLKHFSAPSATLASTSGFTKGVRTFARGKPITLMDLGDIIDFQEKTSPSVGLH